MASKQNDTMALSEEQLTAVAGGVTLGGCIIIPFPVPYPFPEPIITNPDHRDRNDRPTRRNR